MYWYRDNWTSKKKVFKNLKQAQKSAKNEYGVSVCIYGPKGDMIKIEAASGFTPT